MPVCWEPKTTTHVATKTVNCVETRGLCAATKTPPVARIASTCEAVLSAETPNMRLASKNHVVLV